MSRYGEKPPRAKEDFTREKGYFYFIGKDGYVWAAPMKHNKTGVKKRVGTRKIPVDEVAGFQWLIPPAPPVKKSDFSLLGLLVEMIWAALHGKLKMA